MNRFEFLQTVFKIEFLVLFYTSNDRFHQVYFKKLLSCRPFYPCYIVVTWNHNFWTERNFYKRFSKLNSSCFFTPGMIDFIKFTLKKYHFVAQTYQFKLSVWLVHNFLMERNFDKRFENLSSTSNFTLELISLVIPYLK